jgi:hypothetical protein
MLDNDTQDRLQFALDGKYRELRQDNHVTPNEVLVFDAATGTVEAVDLMDLPLRFPLKGKGCRWSYADLGKVLEAKALLYRQSMIAHEISDEDPEAQPPCGTVVIVQHAERHCLSWFQITARIEPELDD